MIVIEDYKGYKIDIHRHSNSGIVYMIGKDDFTASDLVDCLKKETAIDKAKRLTDSIEDKR